MDASIKQDLREAVDETFGEAVRHLPLSGGRVDGERLVSEFVAVLRTGGRASRDIRVGRGETARPGVTAVGGTLRIDRDLNPTLVVRKHDKVVALERPGVPVFEILSVDDRSHLRLICQLGDAN